MNQSSIRFEEPLSIDENNEISISESDVDNMNKFETTEINESLLNNNNTTGT